MRFLPFVVVLAGCPSVDPAPEGESVVTFETSDGETLEADWFPAESDGAGVVVLLHMIPPSNDRTGYPPRVREALHELGVNVLNVDRRGAGGSTGDAEAAYEGPGGQLDVEAAATYAFEQGADPDRMVLVGASNGTTSVFDYVVGRDGSVFPTPAAVVLMSPGTYTENQHAFPTEQADWLWNLSWPWLWLYPTDEPYSEAFVPDAPGAWRFVQDGTEHGTNMFDGGDLEESTLSEITAWVEAVQ